MNKDRVINFMGFRKIAAAMSVVLLLASVTSLAVNGLNFGLDFTHGTELELHYEHTADIEGIRQTLRDQGYPNAVVTSFGSDQAVLVRIQTEDAKLGDKVTEILRANTSDSLEQKRVSFVGPQIGEELRDEGGLGMLLALAVVMAYVAVRFQFKFSIGAVVALVHDVTIVLGAFSIFQLEFNLTVLAAVLAVVGYSLNDTIVVADRIRENFRMLRKTEPLELVNISLTQTLGRTTITSGTTLFVLFALFFLGGEMIHNFAVALILGVVVGTYSSIYVASNILLAMKLTKEDLMQIEKEGADQEELMP
ncbi:MAG: preprotein translocase subunit SecF [Lentisphaeria bacterium]|jgi:preprotein translocase subunit SecF